MSEHKRRGLYRLPYKDRARPHGVDRGFVMFAQYLAIKEHKSIAGAPQQCCSKKKKKSTFLCHVTGYVMMYFPYSSTHLS